MSFRQWLFGYSNEDIEYLHRINKRKPSKKKDWKKEVDKNSLEEYEMCQWYIDNRKKRGR